MRWWPPAWLARLCARWVLRSHESRELERTGIRACGCPECDKARRVLELP